MMSDKHPNQWFLDICPDQWHDKDYFIEMTLAKALIHFWEDEDGEKSLRYQFEVPCDEELDMARDMNSMLTRYSIILFTFSKSHVIIALPTKLLGSQNEFS